MRFGHSVRVVVSILICAAATFSAKANATDEVDRAPGTAGLLTDIIRIVDAYERAGWFVDVQVYAEAEPLALESLCRATPAARADALQVLQGALLGDPREMFERAGRSLTPDVELALTYRRRFDLLVRALARANAECPFWLAPAVAFEGRQTTRNKWSVDLEGGGVGQLRLQQGEPVVGAGGHSRLLLGRGFGDRFSVLLGAEFGGGALLKSTPRGQFTINYLPAIPLVLRYTNVAWLYDLELAPVGLFQADDTRVSYGGRIGAGVGLAVLRVQNFLPWAGIAASYDHYFPSGGRSTAGFLRVGARVGVRWLP